MAKREQFAHMVDSLKPDIIVGTESWLSTTIGSCECFPLDDYQIERRDRESGSHGGGVFIASKRDLIMDRTPELETDCEILWCKMELQGSKTLHVGAYYRPHESDEHS